MQSPPSAPKALSLVPENLPKRCIFYALILNLLNLITVELSSLELVGLVGRGSRGGLDAGGGGSRFLRVRIGFGIGFFAPFLEVVS
jgi:hypothetical protein